MNNKQIHLIGIVSDVICPWCYIGKHRLEQSLNIISRELPAARAKIQLQWLPFELNPGLPESGMDRGDYCRMKFGSLEYANKLYANVAANARSDGLPINLERISVTPNTRRAHRLIYLASQYGCSDKIVDALFRAYFVDGADIGQLDVLSALASRHGLDEHDVRNSLIDDKEAPEFQVAMERAYDSGTQGVPAFLWNGNYLITGAQAPETIAAVIEQQLENALT